MFKRILLAVQFHTVLPVKVNGPVQEEDMAGSIPFFPLAGAAQGFFLAVSAMAFAHFFDFDRYAAGALALAVYIILSGGFDLDGLADTADALSVKSCGDPEADRQKRLEIMKDSHVGAMGVIALIISILLKFVLISGLLALTEPYAFALLFMMPVFSKWATVPVMFHGKPARKEGLGRLFIGNAGAKDVALASLLLLCLWFAVFSSLFIYRQEGMLPQVHFPFLFLFFPLIIFLYAEGRAAARFLSRKFGGLTGDHLGAITEASEILFLIAASLWPHLAAHI
ncbi:MAG: adenosylcobinamide-GDP ribazoletransferase [Nitrospiraceae bacterium]|nr:adenosylcobinamide-GDP ribazoletransferase [Nitrospiraceae bacterium]MDA8091618.1 adenosylcobinamide-GDP ribazoletransferase [Nitrospiraceae bacterium]